MPENKIFYYHFKPLNFWLLLNLFITYCIVCCAVKFTYCCHWPQFYIIAGVILLSWGLWIYKHCFKHKLAVISKDSITIDHCRPLLWKNIIGAEEKIVRCGFRKLKIIVLNTKTDMEYEYNFLQKHNGEFTAFSLPLYPVVTNEEAAALRKIIERKTTYKALP